MRLLHNISILLLLQLSVSVSLRKALKHDDYLQVQPPGGEIHFEDLGRLAPEDVQNIFDWLLEKLDGFAASWKDIPEEDAEDDPQNLNDIDLFTLRDGTEDQLTVHNFWVSHLEDRVMRDGNPRKAKKGEDPARVGLVLEWVYGSIVSTSEKARESAKRQLHAAHAPDASSAWALLHEVGFAFALVHAVNALHARCLASSVSSLLLLFSSKPCRALAAQTSEFVHCCVCQLRFCLQALDKQGRLAHMREEGHNLLREMLEGRAKAADYNDEWPLTTIPPPKPSANGSEAPPQPGEDEFPTHLIVVMLEREKLLTAAKLHMLKHQYDCNAQQVRLIAALVPVSA